MALRSRWWWNPMMKQLLTTSGVLINIVGQGMVLGYPACLLHELRAPDSSIPTDLHAASWIASAPGLSNIGGCVISSLLMDWCGRKKTFIVIIIPSILGWLCIYFASNIATLIIGRLFCGITGGATAVLGAIVIGEYTSPKIRGILLNTKLTALFSGILIVHLMGNYYDWRTIAILAVIPKVVSLIIVATWPESPAWLASKKQYAESEKEYIWLRGDGAAAVREFEEFIEAQKMKMCMNIQEVSVCGKVMQFFKKFKRRDFVLPVLMSLIGGILTEACGKHIFPAYAKDIFGKLSANETEVFYFTLCFDLITCVGAALASILIKVMNRRTLLFSSGVPALVVLSLVCIYLFLVSKEIVPKAAWVPISGFFMFFILTNMGCTLIPLVLLGEIFPLAHRASGTFIVGIMVSLSVALALKTTPHLLATIEMHGTFTVFGSVMAVSLLALYVLQPETKDRTLQDIEDSFYRGRRTPGQVEKDEEMTVTILNKK